MALACATAMLAMAAPAYGQEGDAAPAQDTAGGLKEIVVTAQKKAEVLQKVPVAVTAFTADAIEKAQIVNVASLTSLAPNLNVSVQPAGSTLPTLTIRGVTGGQATPGADNGVSLYVDGVYTGAGYGALSGLADIERVEVLRGPQGTLYGRNSTGGAVNFITRGPSGKFGIRQEFTVGNRSKFRAKTRLDLPEVNGFSAVVTYLHDEQKGWGHNLGAGQEWDFTDLTDGKLGKTVSSKRLGSRNIDGVHADIRYESDKFKASYKADYVHNVLTMTPQQVLGFSSGIGGTYAAGVYMAQPYVGGTQIDPSFERQDYVNNWFTAPEKLKVFTTSLTLSYEFSDQLSIKNILAYRTFTDTVPNGLDGAGGLRDALGSGAPLVLLGVPTYAHETQWTNEFQVNYNSDLVDIVGGLFFYTERYNYRAPLLSFTTVPDFAPPEDLVSKGRSKTHNRSYAAYAQATFHLTGQLDLTGGIRQTKDKRETTAIDTTSALLPPGTFKKSFNHTDWTANITFRPTNDMTLYAKVATGFLSGGVVSAGVPFDPEELTQYEVGAKTEMLDRHLRLNLAAFYSDYRDLQAIDFSLGYTRFTNAGKSRIQGLELEATALPLPGLMLTANMGYTDFKYKSYVLGGVDVTSIYKAVYFPKFNSALGMEYTLPAFGNGSELSFNLGATYRSKVRYTQPTNAADLNEATISPSKWLLDARATLAHVPLGGLDAKISVWGKNLTDSRKLAYAADLGTVVQGSFEEPRTFGIDFAFEY
ncbi:MAG: TonB-dependent receptor [Novosphingobium sp.]|nr:TonB-dependent receptor [Novosphingobium sp.]